MIFTGKLLLYLIHTNRLEEVDEVEFPEESPYQRGPSSNQRWPFDLQTSSSRNLSMCYEQLLHQ